MRNPRDPGAGPRHVTTVFRIVLAVGLAWLLAGCLQMPTEGPVVRAERHDADDSEAGAFYEPRRPAPGATPDEIVFGFLEAMKATPVRTSVAAEFLSERAQRDWSPEDATLTYGDLNQPEGQTEVIVQLIDAHAHDLRGAWSHRLGPREARVAFPMTIEGEEWRIDDAPDALIVPDRWFDEWFEPASLHFFDPTRSILVPEPVFVPGGDQMATSLVRGLLVGPPDPAVSRGAFPAGARLAMSSVPVEGGVAQVALEGPGSVLDEVVAEEMMAQLAWTLRQVPGVRALRLTIDDVPVTLSGGAREVAVGSALAFNPTGAGSSRDVFALQEGRLVRGDFGDFSATSGPFGREDAGLRSAAVNIVADRAVGVTRDGTRALLAPMAGEGAAVEIAAGATDLLRPHFDVAGRVWLVDRTPRGARVLVRGGQGPAVEVRVPGVTGAEVTKFLVSRDSSRFVAVLRRGGRDRVVVHRVEHGADGDILGFGSATAVDLGPDIDKRINDIGWLSPVSIGVLSDITPDLAQIRVLSVDGAPGEVEGPGGSRIRGGARRLVSTPVASDPVLVVTDGQITDVTQQNRRLADHGESITWFGFVG